jgi:hypothetical protein
VSGVLILPSHAIEPKPLHGLDRSLIELRNLTVRQMFEQFLQVAFVYFAR